jgi:hypothetical protein
VSQPVAAELVRAVAAIEAAGGSIAQIADSWTLDTPGRRQIFIVDAGTAPLQRGTLYTTWTITLTNDGSILAVESFTSTACRPR